MSREISVMTEDRIVFSERVVEKMMMLTINRQVKVRVLAWNILLNIISTLNLIQFTHSLHHYIHIFKQAQDHHAIIISIATLLAYTLHLTPHKPQILQIYSQNTLLPFILSSLTSQLHNNNIYNASLVNILYFYYLFDHQYQMHIELPHILIDLLFRVAQNNNNKNQK